MKGKDKAEAQDLILQHLRKEGGGDHTMDMRNQIDMEEVVMLGLCQELRDMGFVDLAPMGSIEEPFDHFLVSINPKGLFFISYEGGFVGKFLEGQRKRRTEALKMWLIFVQSIAILILTFAPLGYQMYKDSNEKKKVIKLELQAADLEKIKVLLSAPPDVVRHRDSTIDSKKPRMRYP